MRGDLESFVVSSLHCLLSCSGASSSHSVGKLIIKAAVGSAKKDAPASLLWYLPRVAPRGERSDKRELVLNERIEFLRLGIVVVVVVEEGTGKSSICAVGALRLCRKGSVRCGAGPKLGDASVIVCC